MSEARDTTPACIVVDCNEWIRLRWLGSPVGLAFIATIRRDPTTRLAVPEVLEGELNKHRAETARALLSRLKDAVEEINTVTGRATSAGIVTLEEEDIDVAIHERLAVIGSQVLYPKMHLDEVRRALQRVNAETAPNGQKNQQMKDSLLWEACLALTAEYQVFFVTGDKGFYADRDTRKGPAANLAAEEPVREGRLCVFPSLETAMAAFAPEAAVDTAELANVGTRDLIAARAEEAFRRSPIADDLRPEITLRGVMPSYLRTDMPHVFAVSFTAFFHVNKGVQDRSHGEAAVTGQCQLDAREVSIDAVSLQTIHWTLTDPNGGMVKAREVLDGME